MLDKILMSFDRIKINQSGLVSFLSQNIGLNQLFVRYKYMKSLTAGDMRSSVCQLMNKITKML